ncbi:MAG: GDP-mannose 4,6-dehydratase [Bryobacterales bacterium]|nr:GDP-mannose 4,6-dehydratase [Bryobacteraceae bacterium]MDW8352975.1 GDP-mannose 4,6-dehydratase [Bryobacterales bacterium]
MSFWRDRNVFVTGATGLLGSWLVEELVRQGANVTCLIRDWVPASRLVLEGFLEQCNVVRGELEDLTVLVRALNEYEIDTVFHLGAQTIVGVASRSPLSTFEANVRGTWNVLEACRICPKRIERVVIASSDKAYGEHPTLPYTEDLPLRGRFPYDASKSCAELIAGSYYATYGVPLTVTRCGNLFGGGDLNYNRLVPGTIRSALRDEPPVIRSDGQFIRDYFYVRDAVEAYLMLAEKLPREDLLGQAFNFGYERALPVLEMVELILKLCEKPSLKPKILNEATHEIPAQSLDCSKARRLLGWSPRFTLEEALRETIAWYRAYLRPQPRTEWVPAS